jgi:hypothetical protein
MKVMVGSDEHNLILGMRNVFLDSVTSTWYAVLVKVPKDHALPLQEVKGS